MVAGSPRKLEPTPKVRLYKIAPCCQFIPDMLAMTERLNRRHGSATIADSQDATRSISLAASGPRGSVQEPAVLRPDQVCPGSMDLPPPALTDAIYVPLLIERLSFFSNSAIPSRTSARNTSEGASVALRLCRCAPPSNQRSVAFHAGQRHPACQVPDTLRNSSTSSRSSNAGGMATGISRHPNHVTPHGK
jgi:hypothetical protein